MLPLFISEEVWQRALRLELPFNSCGVDRYGISRPHIARAMSLLEFLYRRYFSVRVHGIQNVPARGAGMLVGNHSGGVAIDGAMVIASCFFELEPPRLAQGMVEKFINRWPFASQWTNRTGQFTGLPEHATQLLASGRLLMTFPEGARGTAKLYNERYSLVSFGTGFMRLALAAKAPIIPFGFLGGGEAVPTIFNSQFLGSLVGAPYVPITPYLVAFPLPVELDIYYGEPMVFEGSGNEADEVIAGYVEQVRTRIAELLQAGLDARNEGLKVGGLHQ